AHVVVAGVLRHVKDVVENAVDVVEERVVGHAGQNSGSPKRRADCQRRCPRETSSPAATPANACAASDAATTATSATPPHRHRSGLLQAGSLPPAAAARPQPSLPQP